MQETEKVDRAISPQPKPPSEASAQDRQFYVSFGLVMSVRLDDVERIREMIESLGGKIAFQTVTTAPLYVLRHYQVEQILRGDLSHIREVHDRKSKERRVKQER